MGLARRVVFVGLLFAFIAMQTLGFMHRVVHGPHGGQPSHAAAAQHEAHGHGALFAGHDDTSPDCRVYDQLSHGDFLGTACALALPSVPPAFRILLSQGEAVARWAALFDARGPPSVL